MSPPNAYGGFGSASGSGSGSAAGAAGAGAAGTERHRSSNDDANAAMFNDGLGLNEEKLHYLLNLGPDFDTDFRDEVTGPAGPTVFDNVIDNPVEPVDDLIEPIE